MHGGKVACSDRVCMRKEEGCTAREARRAFFVYTQAKSQLCGVMRG